MFLILTVISTISVALPQQGPPRPTIIDHMRLNNMEALEATLVAVHLGIIANTSYRIDTLIHAAVQYRNPRALELLLAMEGAYPDAANPEGYTPLMRAAYNCDTDIVEILLRTGGVNRRALSPEGYTPLMAAISATNNETDLEFIDECRRVIGYIFDIADTNPSVVVTDTPLILAVSNLARNVHADKNIYEKFYDIVEFLVEAGVNTNIPDILGLRPLEIAARSRLLDLVLLLLNNGANPDYPLRGNNGTMTIGDLIEEGISEIPW